MFGFHNADYEIMQSHAYFLRAKLIIKIPHGEMIMQRYLKCVYQVVIANKKTCRRYIN